MMKEENYLMTHIATNKIMKKIILKVFIASALLIFPMEMISAQGLGDMGSVLNDVAHDSGYKTGDTNNVDTIVGTVIQAFISLLGVIFLAIMVYGGYLWMTDMGNAEKVDKAKKLISAAIIGLIITVGAYAISYFVIAKMAENTLT